ncbi:hypothetical protein QJS04_geneDACA017778 [Acorus gramineus]|uniref:Uncharacterized protein n=1 Tax=Acorus gramineus TaxID=55184 RepID=A0AAV9BUB1_ACOGR|nr:hypothetical protein QJS04_geneDACA017778 [Acorus gramineus]
MRRFFEVHHLSRMMRGLNGERMNEGDVVFSSASTRREFLKLKNKSVQEKNLQSDGMKDIALETDRTRNQRPLYAKHPMSKFTWTTAEEDDTAEWSNMCLGYLNNIENFYNGKDNAEIIYSKAVQMFHGKDDDMQTLLEKELKSGDLAGLHHECPFSWGPAVGRKGVRTEHSLPNVGKTIGAVKGSPYQGTLR